MRLVLIAVLLAACSGDRAPPGAALPALCQARVDTTSGERIVDVEADYLPHVVACENGTAADEALRAQAVAARSYLYFTIQREGRIADSQSDQVYGCRRAPEPRHYRAVAATAGEILLHDGAPIAGFFVAGAPPRADCRGGRGATEPYVTYNDGRRGDAVRASRIGGDHPANRGCLSQRGSHCLAQAGRDYQSILRFYYGADVDVVRAAGPCLDPLRAGVGGGFGARERAGLFLAAVCAAGLVTWRLRRHRRRRR